ncbi:MAG TPA: hypothetical protein VGQ04_12935 [Chitinophagaceae bacterium]|jgi:hypothetical protein|nr:hypothetical protein [Chitinophagaceae bacterium]
MNEYVLFQSFFTEDEATSVIDPLKENGIDYQLERSKELLDRAFIGDNLEKKIFLKIRSSDFLKANEILDARILQNITALEKDYYLFSFTNDELIEILRKPDEWSRQDFLIARKILEERGQHINEEVIKDLKSKRINELSREESEPTFTIITGYILALIFSIVGLFFGLTFLTAKKNIPNGKKVFTYSSNTRKHGRNIVILSAVSLFFLVMNGGRLIFFLIDLFNSLF